MPQSWKGQELAWAPQTGRVMLVAWASAPHRLGDVSGLDKWNDIKQQNSMAKELTNTVLMGSIPAHTCSLTLGKAP